MDIVDAVLSVSEDDSVMLGDSELESGELTEDDKLNDDEGDGGLLDWPELFFVEGCAIPLMEIRCTSNLLGHNSACGGGPEMGL